MIATQNNLDQLADRIERAYHLRHPNWLATGLTPGVWTAAAVRLHEVVAAHSFLPVDPELFVAAQSYKTFRRDPWCELTQEGACKAYRSAVRKIIRQLKRELAGELRRATRFLEAQGTLDELVASARSKVSPMIKLMLCHQNDRSDLALHVNSAAEAQHLACPLYRIACKNLIPGDLYPLPNQKILLQPRIVAQSRSFAWN